MRAMSSMVCANNFSGYNKANLSQSASLVTQQKTLATRAASSPQAVAAQAQSDNHHAQAQALIALATRRNHSRPKSSSSLWPNLIWPPPRRNQSRVQQSLHSKISTTRVLISDPEVDPSMFLTTVKARHQSFHSGEQLSLPIMMSSAPATFHGDALCLRLQTS